MGKWGGGGTKLDGGTNLTKLAAHSSFPTSLDHHKSASNPVALLSHMDHLPGTHIGRRWSVLQDLLALVASFGCTYGQCAMECGTKWDGSGTK